MDHPPASAECRRPRASPARLEAWLAKHADMPGADFLRDDGAVRGQDVRVSIRDAFVHELVDSIIGDNYPVPDRMLVHNERIVHEYLHVGDVRRAAAGRQVRPLRGRRRHGGDVLHLQVAEGQPAAASRRHHRARHADLHALSRDDASRGLRPQGRAHQGAAGEPLPVHRRGNQEARGSEDQGVLHRQSRQSDRNGDEQGDDRQDRQAGQDQAPRPDAADRRRLRHVRRRFPLAAWRAAAQHHRRLFLLQVFRLHRLAARRHRDPRGQHLRQDDRQAARTTHVKALDKRYGADDARAAQDQVHRSHRRRQPRRRRSTTPPACRCRSRS